MLGLDPKIIAFIGLAVLAAAAVVYTFLFDKISNENRQDKRVKNIQGVQTRSRGIDIGQARIADAAKRRQNMQKTLQDLEKQNSKAKKRKSLKEQFKQAGWKTSVQKFILIGVVLGLVVAGVSFVLGVPLVVVAALWFVVTLGAPRWWLARVIKKRQKKFLEEFPNSVDVIVRGIKAGLPLNDCMAIVSRESKEPVASEFKKVLETQQMGIPMTEAVMKLYENIPLTETNFFGIVIAIQQQAGGNLSEALGNLSGVLRDRKKMKAKIQAMSAEAKASGMIIGALPLIVGGLVYLTTPDYIKILFTHPTGNLILLGSAIWMGMGILIMKNMINFDF